MRKESLEDKSISSLNQLLENLPSDHPEKNFLERIGRQFGFNLLVSKEEEKLILNDGDKRAEIFRRLTSQRGMPSTHCSHYLSGPKAPFWEEKTRKRKRKG